MGKAGFVISSASMTQPPGGAWNILVSLRVRKPWTKFSRSPCLQEIFWDSNRFVCVERQLRHRKHLLAFIVGCNWLIFSFSTLFSSSGFKIYMGPVSLVVTLHCTASAIMMLQSLNFICDWHFFSCLWIIWSSSEMRSVHNGSWSYDKCKCTNVTLIHSLHDLPMQLHHFPS